MQIYLTVAILWNPALLWITQWSHFLDSKFISVSPMCPLGPPSSWPFTLAFVIFFSLVRFSKKKLPLNRKLFQLCWTNPLMAIALSVPRPPPFPFPIPGSTLIPCRSKSFLSARFFLSIYATIRQMQSLELFMILFMCSILLLELQLQKCVITLSNDSKLLPNTGSN